VLFFHGNTMKPSLFFQKLDDRGLQISNNKLCNTLISMILMIYYVNLFFQNFKMEGKAF
jgi:hypothetical protein